MTSCLSDVGVPENSTVLPEELPLTDVGDTWEVESDFAGRWRIDFKGLVAVVFGSGLGTWLSGVGVSGVGACG